MRTFILLLCTTVFGFTSKTAFSQNAKVVIKADMEVTIDQVFTIIKQQTNYRFIYYEDLFKNAPKVHLDKGVTQVNKLLKESLSSSNYKIEFTKNNTIVVTPVATATPNVLSKTQDPITITGKIIDQSGQSLPGVNVVIKGTNAGVYTDLDGYYKIIVPNQQTVLLFSFIGFVRQDIQVGKLTEINVIMQTDISALEDVVINTGYQKIKPEQSTGAISTIRAKEYNSRINTTDFLTGLQNKIPGLVINSDIKFEENGLFQIRGISTINGNKQPLIVVDGYPTELKLDMINPNEIESITVLKDAAASTIYGVRASNGVIVVERKKAKSGKPIVNFRTTTSMISKENYSRYRWDKDGSNTVINYDKNFNYQYTSPYDWSSINDPYSGVYYNYTTPGLILAQERANVITTAEANQQYATLGAYNNTKDYSRLFLRTATSKTYSLDISGGNDNALYYLTANYIDNNGSQIKNDNSSFQLSARTTVNFSKRFSMDLTNDFQQGKTSSVPVPDINNIYPYERFQDNIGNPLPLFNGSYINPYYNDHLKSIGLMDNLYYPLVDINEVSNKSSSTTNRITANFRYNIGHGFNANFGGSYESSHTEGRHLANENSSEVHQYINRYVTDDGFGGFLYNIPKGGFLKQSSSNLQSYTLRAQLNYDKKISENHSFNIIFGGEIRDILNKSNLASYFGYSDQTLIDHAVNYNTLFGSGYYSAPYGSVNPTPLYSDLFNQKYNDNRYVSAYSNAVYSYKAKYSLTGSARIDQSNLFGTDPKYKYKPLWSVGATWNIHKENFMQNLSWLNSLKLRTSYGFNGNVAKNALPQVIAQSGFNSFYYPTSIPQLDLLTYANSGLRWEQTKSFNVGLDYEIFKGINGSIDYYVKKSTDVLASSQIDATKGATTALVNQASISNKGLEISLHADWIKRKDFNWNTGFILSHNKSEVLEVYNSQITAISSSLSYVNGGYSNYLKGYEVGAMFNYRYAGLDEQGRVEIYDKEGNKKLFYSNDEGLKDLEYSGSSVPTYNLGLSNRVDIGSFYVYAMVNYYGGFKVRIPVPTPNSTRPLEGANNYWELAGDELNPNTLPSLGTSNSLWATDKYTVNGDYFTLGDLTAAYSLRNSNLVKKTGLTNVELSLQASNLYTVALNKYNYSVATGNYAKPYLTPTYTIAIHVNF